MCVQRVRSGQLYMFYCYNLVITSVDNKVNILPASLKTVKYSIAMIFKALHTKKRFLNLPTEFKNYMQKKKKNVRYNFKKNL